MWGERNNLDAEKNIVSLLSQWRKLKRPIIHIKHCSVDINSPLHLTHPGNAYKDNIQPIKDEKEFTKSVNSALIGTNLEDYLKKENIESMVIVGFTTDHCVSTTTRMASNLGFNVTVISDATVTFSKKGYDGHEYSAELIHKINLASLNEEFCIVKTTSEILIEESNSKETR